MPDHSDTHIVALATRDDKAVERGRKMLDAIDRALAPTINSGRDEWYNDLMHGGEGTLKSNIHNGALLVYNHPELANRFALNLLGYFPTVLGPLPWDIHGPFPRRVRDSDIVDLAAWLDLRHISLARQTVEAILTAIASRFTYDPIAEYLSSPEWDGENRIDALLPHYMGSPDTDATRAIGRKFMIASVARALAPGCKMDNVLVMEGAQGIRKSTSVKVLYGKDWTLETMTDIGTKDARQQIGGYWAVELPELHHLTRSETRQIKAWMSTQVDDYRPPYGRFNMSVKRRCVFIATNNPGDGWLDDPTGARRFWITNCDHVDIDRLALDRDQLWAEATHAYKGGEQWWFDEHDPQSPHAHAMALIRNAQEDRFANDAWHNRVGAFLAGTTLNEISLDSILSNLNIPMDRWDRRIQIRVGAIITKIGGWKKIDRGKSGARERYVYVREEPAPLPPVQLRLPTEERHYESEESAFDDLEELLGGN